MNHLLAMTNIYCSSDVCLQCRRPGFDPWVRKMPWRKKWQPTPVFLPRESHGLRSLVGYRPWGHKESDTTERLTHTHTHTHTTFIECLLCVRFLANIIIYSLYGKPTEEKLLSLILQRRKWILKEAQ